MPKISIIIPVFNVEKYIEKSLISIKNQTFKEFECIIVDDGSQDKSINIAKKVINNDKRFFIVSKENGGLSDARNFGLELAKAEYICFQDSDDFYSEDFLQKMHSKIEESASDVVICDTNFVNENGEIIRRHRNNIKKTISGKDAFIDVTISKNILCITQNKLFRKKVFDGIQYPLKTYYEDRATTYKLFLKSEKISFVDEYLFNYLQRKGSITNSLKEKNLSDRVLVMNLIKDYFIKENLMKDYHQEYLICYLLNVYLSGAAMIAKNAGMQKKWYEYLLKISNKKLFTIANIIKVRRASYKKMIALFLLKINYRLFYSVFNKFN